TGLLLRLTVTARAPMIGPSPLAFAGAAEPAGPALARRKFIHDVELGLHDGHDHELRETLHRIEREGGMTAVPRRDHQLALVVRVDQADEVAQHDAVFVTETRTRQDQRRVAGIADMHGES